MRIACPVCAAAYEVPERLLAPGRPVRCARCASDWVPLPAPAPEAPAPAAIPMAPDPAPLPEPPPPVVAPAPGPAPARGSANRLLLPLAWAASLCVVGGALWAAYAERDAVVRAWPPSLRAYRALGVAPAVAPPLD